MPRGLAILAGVVVGAAVLTFVTRGDTGVSDVPAGTTEFGGREGAQVETTGAGVEALPPAQTLEVDGVEWSIEPLLLDGDGAVFAISMDTHAGDLDMDLAELSSLEVGEVTWGPGRWEGDPPGGHHRQGRLRFEAAGPLEGSMTLVLDLVPIPVVAVWGLGG